MAAAREVLVLEHGELAPAAQLGDWLASRGLASTVVRVDQATRLPRPDGFAFVASLGSRHSPRELEVPHVALELELLRDCITRAIPVLGLCYGGQALAAALGGAVEPIPEPEYGWQRIESDDPELIADGPWLQWHYEAFSVPPGATELARSAAGPQAFASGPHLGVQFHPEATSAIVAAWARADPRLAEPVAELVAELDRGERRYGADARHAASRLFDGFWQRCRCAEPMRGEVRA